MEKKIYEYYFYIVKCRFYSEKETLTFFFSPANIMQVDLRVEKSWKILRSEEERSGYDLYV